MQPYKAKKGFTLIEIILAIAILGMLVVAFMPILGNSFIRIFDMGSRTKAMSEAQAIIDTRDYSAMVQYTDYNSMLSTPYNAGVDANGRYCIRPGNIVIPGFGSGLSGKTYDTNTVMIFYGNKKQYVLLTTVVD